MSVVPCYGGLSMPQRRSGYNRQARGACRALLTSMRMKEKDRWWRRRETDIGPSAAGILNGNIIARELPLGGKEAEERPIFVGARSPAPIGKGENKAK